MTIDKKNNYFSNFQRLLIIFLPFLFVSCAQLPSELPKQSLSSQTIVPINKALFSAEITKVISLENIFSLSPKQREEFIAYHDKQLTRGIKSHRALSTFLQNRLSSFTYYGETLVAEKAMRLNKGNCMSLAILTTALAKVIGLEVSYREVNSLPIFEKHNNLILSASHVQTIIYDADFIPDEIMYYLSRPGIVIDYFPNSSNRVSKIVSTNEFESMYYTNIAATSLVDGDVNKAFSYADKAYSLAPQSKEVINLLAVLHRRAGDDVTAEQYYQLALAEIYTDITLLSNYAVLLKSNNREDEAQQVIDRLEELDDPNPYHWLEQAI